MPGGSHFFPLGPRSLSTSRRSPELQRRADGFKRAAAVPRSLPLPRQQPLCSKVIPPLPRGKVKGSQSYRTHCTDEKAKATQGQKHAQDHPLRKWQSEALNSGCCHSERESSGPSPSKSLKCHLSWDILPHPLPGLSPERFALNRLLPGHQWPLA